FSSPRPSSLAPLFSLPRPSCRRPVSRPASPVPSSSASPSTPRAFRCRMQGRSLRSPPVLLLRRQNLRDPLGVERLSLAEVAALLLLEQLGRRHRHVRVFLEQALIERLHRLLVGHLVEDVLSRPAV